CCLCSCTGASCRGGELDCIDPGALEELYECEATPTTIEPCPADSEWNWVVGDSVQALALAEAVNCSGGWFEVEWVGSVVVNKTIYVADGTVLTITGAAGSNAALDGNSSTRLFTVVDASLHLHGVNMSHGASISGGAIAAGGGSTLTFNKTNFIGNVALGNGGALYVSDGSFVSCTDGTTFVENEAGTDGGAMFVTDGSAVSCGGWWLGNTAAARGGAVRLQHGSSASWSEDTTFAYNTAGGLGGALSLVNFSSVSWDAATGFHYNSAEFIGGGVSASTNCSLSWNAPTVFYSNSAGLYGGAVYVRDYSNVSWSGESTVFDGNRAGSEGGAVTIAANTRVSSSGETISTFAGNSAPVGGALVVDVGSVASFGGTSLFEGNDALGDPEANVTGWGGAAVVRMATVTWDGAVTFVANTAQYGGAMFVSDSRISWSEEATLARNNATESGGAIYASSSDVSWSGVKNTVFDGNQAAYGGGGMTAIMSTTVSCTEEATSTFSGNSAALGGGLVLLDGSILSFSGHSYFMDNAAVHNFTANSTTGFGGAMHVSGSTASWIGETEFSNNSAVTYGGAMYVIDSTASWIGETGFFNNSAMISGGAMHMLHSTASWVGETGFFNNSAVVFGDATAANGGAIAVGNSTASWDGNTTLSYNRVENVDESDPSSGGALYLFSGSNATWGGGTTLFEGNVAAFGSAVRMASSSSASWRGLTKFVGNSAVTWGTLFLDEVEASWAGETEFSGNTAQSGGVMFIRNASTASWTGVTNFTSNQAFFDGGAIVSPQLDSEYNPIESNLNFNGTTTFFNNTCGGNGGGMALYGGCALVIDTEMGVSFIENTAAVSGGAVFVSSAGTGLVFPTTSFVSNSAQIGGAVATFGSGGSKGVEDIQPPNPTTFDRCRFVGNRATATGGAIDTAAGYDFFVDTTFEDNAAGTGGALRLAGTASIINCSFVENYSNDGGGAAVSNIGIVSSAENISFSGNGFDCPTGMFLAYNESDDLFETVCDGCQTTCDGCAFAEPLRVPMCTDLLEHSTSPDGKLTLEALSIQRGYWRATTTSEEVLACYHPEACLGGVTGTAGYCLEGYQGPYCAVCSHGFSAQFGFTCRECSDSAGGIVLAVALAVVGIFAAVVVVSYVTSGKRNGRGQGIVERVARYIPLQSVKIVVVAWQVVTQFTVVANVTYPDVYQTFLDGLKLFNFDLGWILSAGCVAYVDFHDRLLMSTIAPIIAVLVLACTYAAATRIHRGATDTTLQNVWDKHVLVVLLLSFFVYSSVSSTLFRTFACETLEDGKNYLRADYRIECDSSRHKGFEVYAGIMMLVYTVGIPSLYGFLLYRDRDFLNSRDTCQEPPPSRVTSTSDLWKSYRPSVFYYEVIECGRRVLLAGVVVFIYPNSSAQIAITLVIAFVFVLISESLSPYASRWDTWISRTGHVVVITSMYVALLLKVDVSDERASSQRVFEALLVAVHVVMVVMVVVETFVLACALRAGQRESPWPRLPSGGKKTSGNMGEEEEEAHWELGNPFADLMQSTKRDKPAVIG
ncbi:unnamed protein product, partial [Ectocarpus fasciculatus]